MRYIIVDEHGTITNACDWDGETEWSPPENCTAIKTDEGEIGGTYIAGVFEPAPTPPAPVAPAISLEDEVALMREQLAALLGKGE